jgi:hypothetical protein
LNIPEELTNLITEAQNELTKNSDGELVLPIRKKIWALLGEYRTELGRKRRTKLARLCVERAMPVWDCLTPPAINPKEMLSEIDTYYKGKIDWETLRTKKDDYWTDLENLDNKHVKYQLSSLVGFAAINAITTAKFDNRFGNNDKAPDAIDDDFDPYEWDASYYASGAVAGFKWIEGASVEKRRKFWEWYLTEAVPQAYKAYE